MLCPPPPPPHWYRLPLETPTGEPLYAESTVKGRKKEAIVQCALEACRLLDAYDVLRGNTQGMWVGQYGGGWGIGVNPAISAETGQSGRESLESAIMERMLIFTSSVLVLDTDQLFALPYHPTLSSPPLTSPPTPLPTLPSPLLPHPSSPLSFPPLPSFPLPSSSSQEAAEELGRGRLLRQ